MERFEPTEEQRRVIAYRGRNLLVFAGPGTGKTETLARRFASIVHDDRISPEAILVLTFSRRAAQGMRRRIVQRMRESSGGSIAVPELHIYTFHGFCKRLLDGDRPRGAGRDLLTPVKERLLWNRVVATLGMKTFAHDVVKSNAFANSVLNLIARLKGEGVGPAELAAGAPGDARVEDLAALYTAMERCREDLGLADFRDLVADAVRALDDSDSEASKWLRSRGSFRHVLVDEFQDSDPMQVRLLEALRKTRSRDEKPPEMCFVGDFNQSIYRFRGAAPDNVVEAKDRFDCDELTLRLNRRSAKSVLDVANRTPGLRRESLTTAETDAKREGSVRLIRVETVDDEVSAIGDAVAERIRAGAKPSDIAVLLRVVEPYRGAIARELHARGIPVAAQTTAGFHDDSLVQCTLDAMAVLADMRGVEAWRRLLTNPLVGFHPLSVSLALTRVDFSGDPQAALADDPPRGRVAWIDFVRRIENCRVFAAAQRRFDPVTLIQTIVRELDLLWPVRDETDVPGFDSGASPARLANLVQAARDVRELWSDGAERLNATRFIDALAPLLGLLGDSYEEPQADESGVPVMSIHAAKGLEFDLVVVPQMIDGVLPAHARPDPLFGAGSSSLVRAEDAAAEEASLWYVALTRARFDVLATAARLGDDAAELPLSQFASLVDDVEERPTSPDRDEHVGFAAAFAAAGADERQSPRVRRYLEQRPVLEALLVDPKLTEEQPRPVAWPLQRLSPSGIETYVACPRRWFYKYVLQLSSDDDDATRMGRYTHQVLERYHDEARDFSSREALPSIGAIMKALAPIADEEARFAAEEAGIAIASPLYRYESARVLRQLEGYAQWLLDEARERPFTVLACERRIEIPIGDVRLIGYPDRIDRLADGTLAIRDYKTGRMHSAKGAAAFASEALGKVDPREPGLGVFGRTSAELKLQTYLYVRGVEAAFSGSVSRTDYLYFRGSDKERTAVVADSTQLVDKPRKGALTRAELESVYDVIAAGVVREVSSGSISSFATAVDDSTCMWCRYVAICPGAGTIDYEAAAR